MKDQASSSTHLPSYSPGASVTELRERHQLLVEAVNRGVCVLARHGRTEVLFAPLRLQHAPPRFIITGRLLERDGVRVKGDAVTIDIATLTGLVVTRRKFTSEKSS